MRRLAWLWLWLCACSPEPVSAPATPATAGPVVATSPAVPAPPAAPVPSDSPATAPRLLDEHLAAFAALADGMLLIEHDYTTKIEGFHRFDPATGKTTPWSQAWTPAQAGWQLADPGASASGLRVSMNGEWVALAHTFTPPVAPKPGEEDLVAIVVSRADGSQPRCVGVGILADEGELPSYAWTSDGRLIGGWSGQCEPGPGGRTRSFGSGGKLGAWPRLRRWFAPQDGSSGEIAGTLDDVLRDPLGDAAMTVQGGRKPGFTLHDVRTGAKLASFTRTAGELWFAATWVAADALLVDVHADDDDRKLLGHRVLFTDGRSVAAPGPGWRVYTRLPGGDVLFTRDTGKSIEQGPVDWSKFAPGRTRVRADLQAFAGPFDGSDTTWTPGLGGVLIHGSRDRKLWLAPLGPSAP